MIFNKKIDRALWLMIEADKENNDNIVKFITSMPEELKKQILDKIRILEEYKKNGVKNFPFLYGEYVTDNCLLYRFGIDPYSEKLEMGYMEYYRGVYRDVFNMILYLGDNLDKNKNFRKNYIGSIEYNINTDNIDGLVNIVNSSKNEYNLYKTPVRDIVVYSKDDGNVIKNHFSLIDFLSIPEELTLDNLSNNISKVRRKKK